MASQQGDPSLPAHVLAIDGWDYWTMDDRVDDTELINRARIDEGR